MSRTRKGTKGPGHEYWGRRPGGRHPCRDTKTRTHRIERKVDADKLREIIALSRAIAQPTWHGMDGWS